MPPTRVPAGTWICCWVSSRGARTPDGMGYCRRGHGRKMTSARHLAVRAQQPRGEPGDVGRRGAPSSRPVGRERREIGRGAARAHITSAAAMAWGMAAALHAKTHDAPWHPSCCLRCWRAPFCRRRRRASTCASPTRRWRAPTFSSCKRTMSVQRTVRARASLTRSRAAAGRVPRRGPPGRHCAHGLRPRPVPWHVGALRRRQRLPRRREAARGHVGR